MQTITVVCQLMIPCVSRYSYSYDQSSYEQQQSTETAAPQYDNSDQYQQQQVDLQQQYQDNQVQEETPVFENPAEPAQEQSSADPAPAPPLSLIHI